MPADDRRSEPDAPARTFVQVVDPTQRPRVRRATVRVLVLDTAGRVLLFRDSDPNTAASWWITPGGGIDQGERELDAVLRELAEETGHIVTEPEVIGPLARRHVVHGYSDRIVEQDDAFYAVRTPPFQVSTDGYTEEEQLTMIEHRWWSPAELATTQDEIWPARLLGLLDVLSRPAEWPVALPDVEESSVPVA